MPPVVETAKPSKRTQSCLRCRQLTWWGDQDRSSGNETCDEKGANAH